MKLTFTKSTLESVVNDSLCSVSDKNTIPVVEGIRFRTEKGDVCSLTTYDLEKGFRAEVGCEVEEPGNFVINAQKLNRIIKYMPDEYITIEVNENFVAEITGGRSKFELHALDGKTFPSLPELDGEKGFTVNAGILRKMINQVFFAISTTDQRPVLCGAYFIIENGRLNIVACDGNRLAVRKKSCEIINNNKDNTELELKFIVPGRTLAQLVKLMDDDSDVRIKLGRKHVIFKMDGKTFFSRLIDGEYIDYDRVIPKNAGIKVVTDRMSIISSLERASLVTEDKNVGQTKSYVKCEFEGNLLKVSSNSITGSVYDEIPIEKTGDDLTIAFNCRYLLEALRAADGDRLSLMFVNPLVSVIIEKEENDTEGEAGAQKQASAEEDGEPDESYLYMVCPVKMKD